MPAPEGIFPSAEQVLLVEHYVNDLDGTPESAATALGLMCLSAAQADPERLATLVRDHWGMSSRFTEIIQDERVRSTQRKLSRWSEWVELTGFEPVTP
jgi:hypothetical protein